MSNRSVRRQRAVPETEPQAETTADDPSSYQWVVKEEDQEKERPLTDERAKPTGGNEPKKRLWKNVVITCVASLMIAVGFMGLGAAMMYDNLWRNCRILPARE